ncbi:MAG TPA: cellulose binding domain-containing protein, partial [Rugosimonospora sp.]|nr:cellulose binding domain-containing protein [Rugosimonospora sp.]
APPSHAPSRAPVRHVPPPSPSPPDPRACSVGYKITLDLGSYFTAQLAIQNTGKADFNGWTVAFQFPQDQHVTSGLAGIWNQTDNKVNVHDLIYNRRIAQGTTLTLDFVGSHHSKTNGAPSLVTVNGVRCQQIAQG